MAALLGPPTACRQPAVFCRAISQGERHLQAQGTFLIVSSMLVMLLVWLVDTVLLFVCECCCCMFCIQGGSSKPCYGACTGVLRWGIAAVLQQQFPSTVRRCWLPATLNHPGWSTLRVAVAMLSCICWIVHMFTQTVAVHTPSLCHGCVVVVGAPPGCITARPADILRLGRVHVAASAALCWLACVVYQLSVVVVVFPP